MTGARKDIQRMPPTLSGSRALRADTTAVPSLLLKAQNAREFLFRAFRRFKNDRIAFGTLKVHYYYYYYYLISKLAFTVLL